MATTLLNTGTPIPVLGFGTSSDGALSFQEVKEAIIAAVQVGYRHFDTASVYNSEGVLGEAVKDAIEQGLVKREELFITSKLWCYDSYPEGVLPALQKSLRELKLDYLDLYLIHWPIRLKEGASFESPKPEELLPLDIQGTWKAMEECVKKGLVKAIGVSNFSSNKIAQLLSFATIPPAVNQVELHPKYQQKKLREACAKFNVHVSAYSPLGAPLMRWGSPAILDDLTIKEIAQKHGKTPAQIVLRWELDQGISAIPKSFNKKRMLENFQVFDWQLTEEDHSRIDKIEQKKNLDGSNFCHPEFGPFRSVQDFWDGDI